VIIPNKDGMRFLPALLPALKAQAFADFEVIVVDDASHDGSVEWIETHHSWVRLLVHRRNSVSWRHAMQGQPQRVADLGVP